ncbi:RagB/SusD family nutrient uptake outer membrane protein [Sphingobacterium prati]|uniref:RagB/SusD family nutrient uptake outer membrane protein n=1 Tax=Sphingobacterium prati TaxID=2737006 RepID=UPI00155374C8|nr:RagB/SusD family nutrient uptake outer membrane protein [Sphingobacterium prati]NPE48307.1 RagB/SusD family nutrient uptake outer membrane protein [Sphingobacterium prati]
MKIDRLIRTIIWMGFALMTASCEKYLEEPSSKSFAVIGTLDDLEALLDHSSMNLSPNAQEVSADNYYLSDNSWNALQFEQEQNMYIWANNNVFRDGNSTNDWSNIYRAVFTANTVLESLDAITVKSNEKERGDRIKGAALFFRAFSFLDAVQIWSVAYDRNTADKDVGIPLRLQSDFNITSPRANVAETYGQIVKDLKDAVQLLPEKVASKTRPSKPAAYGLLARTYLWMGEYGQAKLYADSCLMLNDVLLDYNTLNTGANFPVPRHNVEVILERQGSTGLILAAQNAKVLPEIYDSFKEDDLRKKIFFVKGNDGQVAFKGYYFGFAALMTGVATDEILLTRAECLARMGLLDESLRDLNKLLKSRWSDQVSFEPVNAASQNDVLRIVLEERRKELLFRGQRWMDIKRLNREGANIMLQRTVNGKVYELKANSARFALPLPDDLLVYY